MLQISIRQLIVKGGASSTRTAIEKSPQQTCVESAQCVAGFGVADDDAG
jgi:hypothetical protein